MNRRLGLSAWELALLAAAPLWAFGPLLIIALAAAADSRTLTGADGPLAGDQLQYLAWVRDASRHGLAANLFDLSSSPHYFAHPMFSLSGLATALGAPIQLAYWAWKPVAVATLCAGTILWVGRMLPGRSGAQAAAAALSLFPYSPLTAFVLWAHVGSASSRAQAGNTAGELFGGGELWGYSQTAIAIGLIPVTLGLVERARAPKSGRAPLVSRGAAAAALVISWIHPWQGVTTILILVGLAAWPGAQKGRRIAGARAGAGLGGAPGVRRRPRALGRGLEAGLRSERDWASAARRRPARPGRVRRLGRAGSLRPAGDRPSALLCCGSWPAWRSSWLSPIRRMPWRA